jgi:hypothetical protein
VSANSAIAAPAMGRIPPILANQPGGEPRGRKLRKLADRPNRDRARQLAVVVQRRCFFRVVTKVAFNAIDFSE